MEPVITFENIPRGRPGPPSIATTATALASDVGSVMRGPADAFSRSVTFFKKMEETEKDWSLVLVDSSRSKKKRDQKIVVHSIEGRLTLSKIQEGDELKKVNGKRIGPSYNAERAMALIDEKWEEEGWLSIAVGNEEGDDVLVQATIIKPKPTMTAENMGLAVWTWAVLCIREIKPESLFSYTVLKSSDHILSINDIDCDRIKPEDFNHIFRELPDEVTIVVKRGKFRWSGRFG
jgi:hypothetical protein|mmetsp:Transcript_18649/g.33757  ORF Transcript_18649/g.33757 Transcript_18649/m.33757 type:complete len:234 (+) Transcript_18649:67-768(+)